MIGAFKYLAIFALAWQNLCLNRRPKIHTVPF